MNLTGLCINKTLGGNFSMNIKDITITSLETITAFNVVTGAFLFQLDELQDATIANTQEVAEITGKQGRKLSNLKKNKAVTISGTNGMVSGGLLAVQVGGEFETKATEVAWNDYLTISSDAATTSYKAVGTEGAEITAVYVKNADGTLGALLEQAATTSAGKFTYTPATKTLSFNASDYADGTEIVVYYKRKITADVLDNDSDHYSGKCTLYIDALAEDKCANIYRVQFFVPKADVSGEFSLGMGDNQTVHEFEAESLAGACGNAAKLWSYVIFDEDEADYTTAP